MKINVDRWYFHERFRDHNREDNFTPAALDVLFDYYVELERDTGVEIELDPIAICCEFSEYTENDVKWQYTHLVNPELGVEEFIDRLQEYTTVITVNHGNEPDTYLVRDI
jgi:hypothetical protein